MATARWEETLLNLVTVHAAETSSRYANMLLHDWSRVLPRFWQVVPKEFVKYLSDPLTDALAQPMRA